VLLGFTGGLLDGRSGIGTFAKTDAYATLAVTSDDGHAEVHAAASGSHAGDTADVDDLGIEFRLDAIARVASPAGSAAISAATVASTGLRSARRSVSAEPG